MTRFHYHSHNIAPIIIVSLLPEQNLKKKYGASWAFVTGASSGLGKAISHNLAKQGLNVVLCALDDQLLDDTYKEFVKQYVAPGTFSDPQIPQALLP